MGRFFKRRVITVYKAPEGIIIRDLGARYPSVFNNTYHNVRIRFEVAGTGEMRSVYIPSHGIAPFHTHDGRFRADFIEIVSNEQWNEADHAADVGW